MPLTLLVGLALSAATFDQMLVIGPFASGGRTPCPTDPIAYQLAEGKFANPRVGGVIPTPAGVERKWKEIKASADGWFSDEALGGGYTYAVYDSPKRQTMVLDASGHSMVYVNGVPRGGDPYGFGFVQLPVELRRGKNEFLFSVGRGRVRAKLVDAPAQVTVTNLDPTFPDIVVGEERALLCSVLVMNPTSADYIGEIQGSVDGKAGGSFPVHVTPMTVKKVWLRTAPVRLDEPRKAKLVVSLSKGGGAEFELDGKRTTDMHKRTFQSKVDGSVQYYAVQPSSNPAADAMVVSLHGASVEATSQAASYGQKPWCNIICPTNGRPYGFDWEDWGRLTTMEAIEDAKAVYRPAKDRIYLTGHSMGGHGTWSIGFNLPDQFGAIAPCAGWISFWSYGGAADWKDPDPVETLLRRAGNASDTLKLLQNAKALGIFIQHGDADDNVPVAQAREMRKLLSEFHRDFDWHEEPGQSHWFDTDPEPGANVQDYAPLFDFLSRHRVQSALDKRFWDLTNVNSDGAAAAANVEMISRERALEPSRIEVRTFADGSFEEVKTTNLLQIKMRPLLGKSTFKVTLDGQEIGLDGITEEGAVLSKTGGKWDILPPSKPVKTIADEGGIKACFGREVTGVYGTGGKGQLKDWAYQKARYDAETWWYRGNAALDLSSDTQYDWQNSEGNVVLYGNPSTNSTLKSLLDSRVLMGSSPFTEKGDLEIDEHSFAGDHGVIWSGSLVGHRRLGLVGGTSATGLRAIERVPLFLSGAHIPELFVNSTEMYLKGSKGVVAAGFYGPDWGVESGTFAFR